MKKGIIALIIAIIAVGAIVMLVMASGDDNKENTSNTTDSSQSSTTNEGSQSNANSGEAVETDKVGMTDSTFEFDEIKVKKGTTVTWTNNGDLPHTVSSEGDGPLDSGTIDPGQTFSFTFNEAGSFDYLCEFHPGMTGKVVVTE